MPPQSLAFEGIENKMPFPIKFKDRLELTRKDVKIPSEAWIVYAVCGCEKESCGWEGWMIESATLKSADDEVSLPCMNEQICPNCGKAVFRTDTQTKMQYSNDQSGLLIPGVDFETAPIEYE
jgi:hypothetical protein